jgi:hypothetical protein
MFVLYKNLSEKKKNLAVKLPIPFKKNLVFPEDGLYQQDRYMSECRC